MIQRVCLATFIALVGAVAYGQSSRPSPAPAPLFPVPAQLQTRVAFWERIFSTYAERITILHDRENPGLILDILDFQSARIQRLFPSFTREQVTAFYVQRYQQAFSRFRSLGKGALRYGAIEARLLSVYGKAPGGRAALFWGHPQVHAQKGLSGTFRQAAQRAQPFLPLMEKIFRKKGLPPILTRLPFVESMFQGEALSSVGALGVWQFMKSTAKQYMIVNHFIDERRSPIKATHAAAMLLSENYEVFHSWPLALTAYNFGRGNLEKAVKKLHTHDFIQILERNDMRAFGFAGKNFYAEFIAACRVYAKLQEEKIFVSSVRSQAQQLAILQPRNNMSISEILRKTLVTQRMLEIWNPGLNPSAFTYFRNDHLPSAYSLIIPQSFLPSVKKAFYGIESAGFL